MLIDLPTLQARNALHRIGLLARIPVPIQSPITLTDQQAAALRTVADRLHTQNGAWVIDSDAAAIQTVRDALAPRPAPLGSIWDGPVTAARPIPAT
ncbi:hypothetical protein GKE82_24440 [Conexibacter sp. W3-3-2]|uniref:hypothetical protein n=1 Tax=Conexibacter sp. W3-3-2 TaxID=2675227 RepID=UPI0012B6F57E|nr:hypothetical protein [Conexibacter sp. W3-3-2]MTD47359.1 hypothetical protein [Conexibacter sp. W3-3-2]